MFGPKLLSVRSKSLAKINAKELSVSKIVMESVWVAITYIRFNESQYSPYRLREDLFHILKVRFAKGEISKEEYDETSKSD